MKITDPDIIKNGEKELIEAVKDDLDLQAVREILEKRMAASSLTPSGGEIVVHNNEIAFRVNFDVRLSGSLMFDRQGNYIPESVDEPSDDTGMDMDVDMGDLDIHETLEEIGPESDPDDEALTNQDDFDDSTDPDMEEEDLNISLPDYDLDDAEGKVEEGLGEEMLLDDELPSTDLEEEEYEEDILAQDSSEDIGESDLLEAEEDLVDNDIGDILKESRDFWEQKKDDQ
jgi:hypothetical protein